MFALMMSEPLPGLFSRAFIVKVFRVYASDAVPLSPFEPPVTLRAVMWPHQGSLGTGATSLLLPVTAMNAVGEAPACGKTVSATNHPPPPLTTAPVLPELPEPPVLLLVLDDVLPPVLLELPEPPLHPATPGDSTTMFYPVLDNC